jgi:hypothetical protein
VIERLARIDFHNSTELADDTLLCLCREGVAGWAVGTIKLNVRYSRGADYSGTCFYGEQRVYVNVGRHVTYPYLMDTHVARSKTVGRQWFKPLYTIQINDGYQLALFVFMHELYHLLVKRAKRNLRQKESMCDRFAARSLVDRFGLTMRDEKGKVISRDAWDFQDVDGFVAAARDRRAARRPIRQKREHEPKVQQDGQLPLFPDLM